VHRLRPCRRPFGRYFADAASFRCWQRRRALGTYCAAHASPCVLCGNRGGICGHRGEPSRIPALTKANTSPISAGLKWSRVSDGCVVWHNGHETSREPSGTGSGNSTDAASGIGATAITAMSAFEMCVGRRRYGRNVALFVARVCSRATLAAAASFLR
jgi:hypothetical protein